MNNPDTCTRVIAVANQKGGVGKTTTAINLSACLALARKNILLIDLDPQASTTSGLGIRANQGKSIYRVLLGEETLSSRILSSKNSFLQVIPSEVDLAGAEVDVARAPRYRHRLRDVLAPVAAENTYDFIILDSPPSLGILSINALAAADALLIPVQCEYYALEGLSVIHRLVQHMHTSGANPTLGIEGIVLTMYDARTNLAAQVANEVRDHFGSTVYRTVIPRTVRLSEAPSHGMPIVDYDKYSPGAAAYENLAREFLERNSARLTPPAAPSSPASTS